MAPLFSMGAGTQSKCPNIVAIICANIASIPNIISICNVLKAGVESIHPNVQNSGKEALNNFPIYISFSNDQNFGFLAKNSFYPNMFSPCISCQVYGRKSADRTEHGNDVIFFVFLATVFLVI